MERTPPNIAILSGLYVLYWFVLTMWFTFSVWSALPSQELQGAGMPRQSTNCPATSAGSAEQTRHGSRETPVLDADGQATNGGGTEDSANPLDVVKVSLYCQ